MYFVRKSRFCRIDLICSLEMLLRSVQIPLRRYSVKRQRDYATPYNIIPIIYLQFSSILYENCTPYVEQASNIQK